MTFHQWLLHHHHQQPLLRNSCIIKKTMPQLLQAVANSNWVCSQFTIDNVHNEEVECEGAAAMAQHQSNHLLEESKTNNNKSSSIKWTGNLPLYTTFIDI